MGKAFVHKNIFPMVYYKKISLFRIGGKYEKK